MFTVGALSTNCYLCSRGSDAIVIDPGHGAHQPVFSYVDDHDLTVKGVFLTHGHLDHSRDAGVIANQFSVPVWLHPADHFMLKDTSGLFRMIDQVLDHDAMEQPNRIEHYTIPWSDPSFVNNGHNKGRPGVNDGVATDPNHAAFPQVAIGQRVALDTAVGTLTVIGAPGHSPGSTMFLLGETCFSGDVLFRGGVGRVDLPGSDPYSMTSTLADVVKHLPRSTEVRPGHGPATTIGTELATNPFLRAI